MPSCYLNIFRGALGLACRSLCTKVRMHVLWTLTVIGAITLLSVFNKVFEVLIWRRVERWWGEMGAVSGLQSACKKDMSCMNASFLLKETVATAMEDNDQVFVAFFDVAKAFDSVWIDGLFFQI